jgi:hypothetical protein
MGAIEKPGLMRFFNGMSPTRRVNSLSIATLFSRFGRKTQFKKLTLFSRFGRKLLPIPNKFCFSTFLRVNLTQTR